jgi:hypothetical protein
VDERWKLWLVFVGNDGGLTGLEEDPSCGGRTEDCVDIWDVLSQEGGTSEEVY